MNIGKRVEELRLAHGLSQADLAKRAKIMSSTVNLIEDNKRPNPYASTIVKLAVALDSTTDYLLGLSPSPEESYGGDEGAEIWKDPRVHRIIAVWSGLDEIGREAVVMLATHLSKL